MKPAFKYSNLTSTMRINEKPQIVQEYESGKAIPNNQIQSKMERALGMSDSQPEKYSLFW